MLQCSSNWLARAQILKLALKECRQGVRCDGQETPTCLCLCDSLEETARPNRDKQAAGVTTFRAPADLLGINTRSSQTEMATPLCVRNHSLCRPFGNASFFTLFFPNLSLNFALMYYKCEASERVLCNSILDIRHTAI